MKRLLVIGAALLLAGCSSNHHIAGDVEWEVPLDMTQSQYAASNLISVASNDFYAVVVGIEENSWMARGYSVAQQEEIFAIPVEGPTTCTLATGLVWCIPTDLSQPINPFAVSLETGAKVELPDHRTLVGEIDGTYYIERYSSFALNLVAVEADTPIDKIDTEGDIVAAYRFDTNEVAVPEDSTILEDLADAGFLSRSSFWFEPESFLQGSQALKDGYVLIRTDGQAEPTTTVTIFDSDSDVLNEATIDASLHLTVNENWSAAEFSAMLSEAEALGEDYSHVAIFQGGEVLGLEKQYSGAVAPAYANLAGFATSQDTLLRLDDLHQDDMVLWVVEYPYVTINGVNDDGIHARTFDVTSGKVLVEGMKCQWTDAFYCFTESTLRSVDLRG